MISNGVLGQLDYILRLKTNNINSIWHYNLNGLSFFTNYCEVFFEHLLDSSVFETAYVSEFQSIIGLIGGAKI